jgi:hypothetical protein
MILLLRINDFFIKWHRYKYSGAIWVVVFGILLVVDDCVVNFTTTLQHCTVAAISTESTLNPYISENDVTHEAIHEFTKDEGYLHYTFQDPSATEQGTNPASITKTVHVTEDDDKVPFRIDVDVDTTEMILDDQQYEEVPGDERGEEEEKAAKSNDVGDQYEVHFMRDFEKPLDSNDDCVDHNDTLGDRMFAQENLDELNALANLDYSKIESETQLHQSTEKVMESVRTTSTIHHSDFTPRIPTSTGTNQEQVHVTIQHSDYIPIVQNMTSIKEKPGDSCKNHHDDAPFISTPVDTEQQVQALVDDSCMNLQNLSVLHNENGSGGVCKNQQNHNDNQVSLENVYDNDADEETVFDDRSLLDVFGEAAKEYLTQRVVRVVVLRLPVHFTTCFC